ncbi:ricin B-like lectin R40C1 [Hordeum vulgare subsp. vulgare]|uniref:Uncharacterized protein n=1 Tax=Hordeum vulgare subsp. vulgare TaxID=112509 RepID=A0A8I6YB87_HORVV|nr:ricin B-like lectin R40C1 [Hordeum vulgare subsp. vulgare]
MEKEQPLRIFCRNSTLNAAVRGHKVKLVLANPSDKSQHWIRDYSAVGHLTDDNGSRAFALVNITTGQAMVNVAGAGEVRLAPYSSHVAVELSKLWTMGEKGRDGFAEVKVLQDVDYTLNGINGNVKEGTVVGTYTSEQTDNALWKIVPVNEE